MKKSLLLLLLLSFENYAETYCGASPFQINVKVDSHVKFNHKNQVYEYFYNLENLPDSKLPLIAWWLLIDEKPLEMKSPTNWEAPEYKEHTKDSDSETPGNLILGTLGARKYFLNPGQTAKGFLIKSKHPPGIVKYYINALSEIPIVKSESEAHEAPNCPGFLYDLPLFDTKVNGFTTGPAPTNQISVEMKLKKVKEMHPVKYEESDEADINEFTPKKDNGKIAVILKGTNDFDVNTLKVDSVRIGIGQAPVLASSFFGAKKGEKIRLVFESTKLGLECDRDRALFLKGKTTNGKDVLGAVSIKTINCGAK